MQKTEKVIHGNKYLRSFLVETIIFLLQWWNISDTFSDDTAHGYIHKDSKKKKRV